MRRSLLLLALLAPAACAPQPPPRAQLQVGRALAEGRSEGFERALAPRDLRFPRDHGPHPGFQLEWWYFTGNLADESGRRFGYQLTFFRSALRPDPPDSVSRWAARDAWMAHLAVSDVEGGRFHAFERFERGALDLAGAQADPLRVWVAGWSAESIGEDTFPLRLRAEQDGVAIELVLEPEKDLVLQGDAGLSQKGSQPGNASYYYSFTRLATRGALRTPRSTYAVEGSSWLDREWSTSALEPGLVGWDWFALQLDDGRELMLYGLRRADGSPSPHSAGTLVAADGSSRRLALADFELEVSERWTSPRTGVSWPAGWRVRVPSAGLDLEVRPALAAQELDLTVLYWEGAVDVRDASGPRGRGYVELTGYR